MFEMKLEFFTKSKDFPFFIQYGLHNDGLFMHSHENFTELLIVLKGTATHIIENERFTERFDVKEGDVFVLGGGISHGFESVKSFEICNIMFRPDDIFSADYDIKQSPGFHALFYLEPYLISTQGFKNKLTLAPDDFVSAGRLIEFMVIEYESDSPARKTALLSCFMLLAVMFSRLYGINANKPRNIISIAGAAAYIESHYTENIQLKELAEVSHYSLRHFIRLFNEMYRTTPQKYITNIRIRHACALLRESGLYVSEVAVKCGFNDINYFTRTFKKTVGMSPTQFRARLNDN